MANNKNNKGNSLMVGLGMLAALSAGAYYLYGSKEGAKRRVKVRGWALKAKGEVLEKLEGLKEVNEESYNNLINSVMKKYQGLKNVDQEEVSALIVDLKKYWKNIKGSLVKKPTSVKSKKVSKKVKKETEKDL